MTASHTLPHPPAIRKSGVLVLSGYGIRVQVNAGYLLLHDGIADERRTIRIPKVGHGLKRLIIIGSDGFVTFEALRVLADIEVSLTFLDRTGRVLFVSGPTAPSDSKLRRAQSLALGNGTALKISKELISQKLDGQATLVRDMLHDSPTADTIARFRAELPNADGMEPVRLIEAQAAKAYWQAWSDVPILWPRKDERRVPEHWKRFGSRISPLTHSPRLAATPPNALLNFLYGILESESRLSAVAMGLDPGIGCLHVDAPNRDSLACDLMEVCRARGVDAFILNWLQSEPLRRSDFWEDRNGNCRIVSSLAVKLCETSDTWRKLVAPVAEYVAQELWSSISKSCSAPRLATRLTQRRKRAVKGSEVPEVKTPKPDSLCRGCGKGIRRGKRYCQRCAVAVTNENFDAGRKSAQSPEHLARRASTMRRHNQAIQSWNPSDLPAWLTREAYVNRIQPALASVAKSQIRSILGVSEPYAADIRAGRRRPHPRHWQALAQLVGVSADV